MSNDMKRIIDSIFNTIEKQQQKLKDPNFLILTDIFPFISKTLPTDWNDIKNENANVKLLPVSIPKEIIEIIDKLPSEYSKDKIIQNLISEIFIYGTTRLATDPVMLRARFELERRKNE